MTTKKQKRTAIIPLDESKKQALFGIYRSAGLQVVFDILEMIVTESENALIGEAVDNDQIVLALHRVAHAQRALFQRAVQEIDFICEELAPPAPEPPVAVKTLEDRAHDAAIFDLTQ